MGKRRCLMVGGSGMAGHWINIWQGALSERVEIVGLVDVNEEVLASQGENLGLNAAALYANLDAALAETSADFCAISTPPQFHCAQAVAAMRAGLPVLCEKPIADTLEAALEMLRVSDETGLPCGIIQNYRYAPNKQELVRIRDASELGRLQHVVGRYACDYRTYGSWGKTWRHDMDFGLLFEGSVHHFDMLRFLSGGNCEELQGFGWNPSWSSFKHFSSGFYVMRMDNGVHAAYEGNSSAAGITNCWHREYYRAEFEEGTVEIADGNEVTVHQVGRDVRVYEAPALSVIGHDYLLAEFVDWLDGGPPMATRIQDNIQSFCMVIAAMQVTQSGAPQRIATYLE